jgi:hypothetical protein
VPPRLTPGRRICEPGLGAARSIRTARLEWTEADRTARHESLRPERTREALSLFATQSVAARRLQAALDQFRSSRPSREGDLEAKPLDENEQEELRALGYVGQ